jgi:hypothetical protein
MVLRSSSIESLSFFRATSARQYAEDDFATDAQQQYPDDDSSTATKV